MKDLQKKDFKYIWHPYTQMKDAKSDPPIVLTKAKGLKLFDENGKFYYDTISSWWCNIHGHNHPKIIQAIKNQLKKLDHTMFAGFTHEPAVLLAERLIALMPKHITKLFYSDNGSTAVEVALKMSLQYWNIKSQTKKTKFVALDYGYHGDTVGAMSVSGVDLFNKIFQPLFFENFKAKTPYCFRCAKKSKCDFHCISDLENIFKKHNHEIAGFIIEPMILGAGGMIIYPKEYLEKASKLCKKYKIHLILDEVATGFGRTGKMFAFEHCKNIKPDFICISKAITSGTLPLSATLTTDDIYMAFYDDYFKKKTFYHGHTYTANPIACSIALASLEIFKKENTLKNIQPIIQKLSKGLEKFRKLKNVGDVRNLGMVGAVEFTGFTFEDRIGYKIYKEGLKHNLILRPLGNVLYLYLPLCISEKELKYILEKMYLVCKKFEK